MERGTKGTTTITVPESARNSRVRIARPFSTGGRMLVQNSNQQSGKKRDEMILAIYLDFTLILRPVFHLI